MYHLITLFAVLATALAAPAPAPVYAPLVYPPPLYQPPLYHPPVYRTLHPAPVALSHVGYPPVLPAAYRTVLPVPAGPAVLPATTFI